MTKSKFIISDKVQAKYPELVRLVIATESMDDNEKQYWFDVLPTMFVKQIKRLQLILETERDKLAELEKKYQEEIAVLTKGGLIGSVSRAFRDAVPFDPAHPNDTPSEAYNRETLRQFQETGVWPVDRPLSGSLSRVGWQCTDGNVLSTQSSQ